VLAFWARLDAPVGTHHAAAAVAAAIGWLVLLVTSLADRAVGQLQLVDALRASHPSALGALAVVAYPMGLLGVDALQLPPARLVRAGVRRLRDAGRAGMASARRSAAGDGA
jgi:hypothetical protein